MLLTAGLPRWSTTTSCILRACEVGTVTVSLTPAGVMCASVGSLNEPFGKSLVVSLTSHRRVEAPWLLLFSQVMPVSSSYL
jgi:hypothetical protein